MSLAIILCLAILSAANDLTLGCSSKSPAPDQNNPSTNPSAIKNMLGDNVQTTPYDNSGYDSKNGQANDPSDLKCDFSGPCCWKNSKPPYDTMEWVKASGDPDPTKFQSNFGTSSAPSGNYLLTSSDTQAGPADKAEFQSCLIPCAGDSIKVTLKHWQSSGGPKIQVCEVAQSDPNTLLGCQDLPSSGPGPDTVSLPPGQNVYIAIVGYNMVGKGGNMDIIQDINVDYPPCSSSPQPTTAASATQPPTSAAPDISGECKKVANDFNSGMGNYGPCDTVPNTFQQAGPDPFKNPATGVAKSPDNSKYAAAYLKPGDKACMQSPSGLFQNNDYQVKFQEYKATEGISMRACCDTIEGCPYETGSKVEKGDFRQWYQGAVTCKKGTSKIIYVAENKGPNEGGVGIDNIQVFDASGANQVC
uniref:Uncharacterized protein n=1 Tax=Romanomermis culicivorax TaxID=13658 RepID=A0A915JWK4_ROMCU